MAVDVHWLNDERTILTMEYSGQWTWDELYSAIDRRNAMLATIPHKVIVISELSQAHIKVPPNALSNVKNLASRNPDNVNLHVVIGMKATHEALWNIIEKLFMPFWKSRRFLVTHSLDEALEKIAQFQREQSL